MTGTSIPFWQGVCGCTVGAWSAVAALAWCIISAPLPGASLPVRVAASAAVVLGAALTGKLLALGTARVILRALER
jgi:hypothetical protein